MVTMNGGTSINSEGRPMPAADFRCKSTDTKPTTCGVNSLCIEVDTFDIYYFDEDFTWKKSGN